MKVKELIAELERCPQESLACLFLGFDNRPEVKAISPEDCDGRVLLGAELPPEAYARDHISD